MGTEQGAGDTQGTLSGGPSPPTQLWLRAALGRSPGSCSAGPRPSPGVSSPSESVAKQSSFCSERCLWFFHASQAFFLETPVPESSGYVKMCLHLKQKRVSEPCVPRGTFVTTCLGAWLPGVAQPAWEHLQLQGSICLTEFGACLVLTPLSAPQHSSVLMHSTGNCKMLPLLCRSSKLRETDQKKEPTGVAGAALHQPGSPGDGLCSSQMFFPAMVWDQLDHPHCTPCAGPEGVPVLPCVPTPAPPPGEPGGTPRLRRGDTTAAPGYFPPGRSVIFVNAY